MTRLLSKLRGRARRGMELWALFAATLLAALSAFYSARLVWQSRAFNDISTGNDATPLWIPQIPMALGTLIFFIAFCDELVLELRGKRVAASQEDAHHE